VRSKLTHGRTELAEGLIAEGLTLDEIADRLGVHRRTILRWAERDAAFCECYAKARRFAHGMLHDELQDAIVRSGGSLSAAYAARRQLMRRVPKKYGRLLPERRPDLLGALVEAHGCGRLARP
jgi:AcrR family transcriptional regulator